MHNDLAFVFTVAASCPTDLISLKFVRLSQFNIKSKLVLLLLCPRNSRFSFHKNRPGALAKIFLKYVCINELVQQFSVFALSNAFCN